MGKVDRMDRVDFMDRVDVHFGPLCRFAVGLRPSRARSPFVPPTHSPKKGGPALAGPPSRWFESESSG
jgi:hypothetical protein